MSNRVTLLVVTAKERSGREHTWVAMPGLAFIKKDKSAAAVVESAIEKGCEVGSYVPTLHEARLITDSVLEELGLARFEVEVQVTHKIVVEEE